MFTKVLVSDDLDSINSGVASTLKSMGVKDVVKVQYCDDAYLKIKSATLAEQPFQLLITDLSFEPDYREQNFASGEALVTMLKKEHPELRIIVYSVEDRIPLIKKLIHKLKVDGYVSKGRNGLAELEEAIQTVANNERYCSPHVSSYLTRKENLEIDDFDIELVRLLSDGHSQEEISTLLKDRNMSPSSLSSIEKRLNRLKNEFKSKNAIHLVSIVKDLGLI